MNLLFAREAFAFLPGRAVTVATATGRLPVWARSADRHVLLSQIRAT